MWPSEHRMELMWKANAAETRERNATSPGGNINFKNQWRFKITLWILQLKIQLQSQPYAFKFRARYEKNLLND